MSASDWSAGIGQRDCSVADRRRLLLFARNSRACRRRRRSPHATRPDPPRPDRRRRPGLHLHLGLRPGPNPSTALIRLNGREDSYFAGYQKAKRFDGEPDPTDIGHDRNPLAAREIFQPEFEFIPRSTRKSRVELVVEPDFFVPPEGFLHRRDQDLLAVLQCQTSAYCDADDLAGQAFDEFEHRLLLESDAPLADDDALVALAVGDDDALAIHVLDAGGDERDRVPDQIDESVPLLLGKGAGLGRPDQLRIEILMSYTGGYRRAQVRRPPVLIAAVCAIGEVGPEEDVGRGHAPLAARRRRRACGRDGEVGRQRRTVAPPARRIGADPLAGDETEQEIVLRITEPAGLHVAAEMAAIADEGAVDEMAVVKPLGDDYAGKVDMAPGLRPIRRGGDVRREALGEAALDWGACTSARHAIAGRGDIWERRDERRPGGVDVLSQGAGRRFDGDGRVFRRHRPGAAKRAREGIANLRDAHAAGRSHRAAELHRFGVGIGIGEVRDRLAAEEPAQRAVGESEAWDQAVAAGLLHGLAAEVVTAGGKIRLDEGPRLAPRRRRAGLDIPPRLLRAPLKDRVTARMVGLLRDIAEAGDEHLADRQCIQVAVLAGVRRRGAGVPAVGALTKVEAGQVDEAADTDRGVGARDQERPREAAADDRLPRDRLGAERRTRP